MSHTLQITLSRKNTAYETMHYIHRVS